jgi:hypothetical protein
MKPARSGHTHPATGCSRTRLAQSSVASIDRCDCGIFQLHVGALTLRLEAGAARELLATLGEAVRAEAMLTTGSQEHSSFSPFSSKPRGRA